LCSGPSIANRPTLDRTPSSGYPEGMISPLDFKKNVYLIMGLALQAIVIHFSSALGSRINFILFATGYSLFVTGCMAYAQLKGYHRLWGLLGLLSIVGLLVLSFFPNLAHSGLQSERHQCRRDTVEYLNELLAAGSKLDQSHRLIHTFFVAKLDSMDQLMSLLRERGFDEITERVYHRPGRRTTKVVEATTTLIPTPEAIGNLTDTAVELADRCGARYDGWYAEGTKERNNLESEPEIFGSIVKHPI
jgi:hypothetical protein